MEFKRNALLSSAEVNDFIDFFENKVHITANNRERYRKQINLAKGIELFESDLIDIRKIDALVKLFNDGDSLRKTYHRLERYYDDQRLSYYCDRIEEMAKYLDEAKEKKLVGISQYLVEHEDYFEALPKAAEVLEKYRKSDRIFLSDFLKDEKMSVFEFERLVDSAQDLSAYLGIVYKDRYYVNLRERKFQTTQKLRKMYKGITTGYAENGREFDELECYKLFPFKNIDTLNELMNDFNAKNASTIMGKFKNLMDVVVPDKKDAIVKYLYEHNMVLTREVITTDDEIRKTKVSLNGREATEDDKETVIRYLRVTDTPHFTRAVNLVRTNVLKGNIFYDNEEKVLKMKKELR